MTDKFSPAISRRSLLKAGVATAGAAAFAPAILHAQDKRLRKNMMSKDGAQDMASYRKGVAAMLALPLDDPRNWYRNAFVHFIDCPHGNWWFTSWHRGYLGYFEEVIRELSGDEDFMLPYWDWTTAPYVPPSMFGTGNPMDPVHYAPDEGGYIKTRAEFQQRVRPVMESFWKGMTPDQITEQNKRKNFDFDEMWKNKKDDNASDSFQEQVHARFLTAENPMLDANTLPLVALDNVLSNLAPTIFSGDFATKKSPFFENSMTPTHQTVGRFSGLSGTHNLVHNCTGGAEDADGNYVAPYGIMTQNLSPLDPIFFLHHGNIDRLWDVWTRKQQARGLSIQPDDDVLGRYKSEPYLFFTDRKGDPVTDRTTSWDYFATSSFDYGYTPGSGEEIVPPIVMLALQDALPSAMAAAPVNSLAPRAEFNVPEALAKSATKSSDNAVHLASVSFIPPANARGKVFQLYISPQGETPELGRESPDLAGTFSFFGHPHGMPTGFTVSIDAALDRLIDAGRLTAGAPLSFTLAIAGSNQTVDANVETNGQLQSVDVHVLSDG